MAEKTRDVGCCEKDGCLFFHRDIGKCRSDVCVDMDAGIEGQ